MAGAKLFVGCLPYSKTEDDLKPIFEPFGLLQEVSIIRKPDGSSKGAAFVVYQTAEAASTAMSYLQNYVFPGSPRGLNISMSSSTGGGGGGGADLSQQQQQYQQYMAPPAPVVRPPNMSYGKGAQMNVAAQQWQQPYQQPYMVQSQATYGQQHRPQFSHQPMPPNTPYPAAAVKAPGAPGSKVFVGQLPYSRNEADLWQLFGAIGPVAEVAMLKNKVTNEKKGAAFVRFHSPQHAQNAVGALDGFTFSGSPRAISVSLAQNEQSVGEKRSFSATFQSPAAAKIMSLGTQADGALDLGGIGGGIGDVPQEAQEGAKLFVGQLPFSRSEEEIKQVFGSYGQVAEVFLHRDVRTGMKKGGAFVRFYTIDDAYKALELDGYVFNGATRPITVALASEGGAKRQRLV